MKQITAVIQPHRLETVERARRAVTGLADLVRIRTGERGDAAA